MKALFGLVILGVCISALSSTRQTHSPSTFAVEIPSLRGFPPSYVTLKTTGSISSIFYDANLRRVSGGDPNRRPTTALKLDYEVRGELVRITATAYFGNFDRQTTPVSLRNLPSERVGTYSAGLDQSVTLSEMQQFGLEPLTLRIVAAQPLTSVRPQTVSKAPSVRIEIIGEDRTFYKIAVRNLSAKGVTAFTLEVPEKGGGQGQRVGDGTQELIAPGATYERQFGIPNSGRMSNGRFVEDPPAPLLVLTAAFFTDGSYEGDPEAAADIAAQRIGSDLQRQRIDRLIAAILADTQADDHGKIASIRSAVAQLTDEPDTEMLERVRAQFPGLSDNAVQRAKSALKVGLNGGKQSVTFALNEFERSRLRPGGSTLATWWDTWRQPAARRR